MSDQKPTDEMVKVLVIDDGSGYGKIICETVKEATDVIYNHLDALFDGGRMGDNIGPDVTIGTVSRAYLNTLEEADWI